MATNRDQTLREAERHARSGRVDRAIALYEQVVAANPEDTGIAWRLVDLYQRVGQIDRAVEIIERLADQLIHDSFLSRAIASLTIITRLAPQRVDIRQRLAELHVQLGMVPEAKSQCQQLAEWHTRNGDVQKAIDTYKRLVQLDPGDHISHLKLADLFLKAGQTDEALDVYGRLGTLLLQRGKLDQAEKLYRNVLAHNPPSSLFLIPLLNALIDAGRAPAARELLAAALERSPDDADLCQLAERALAAVGNLPEA